jgi:poly-gamma-glutamate synthesis protein (capsule biosynthesis protein)
VAFLAYTDTLNGKEKKLTSDAVKYGVNLVTKSNPANDIKAAREAGADIIVAYVSWGKMGKRDITSNQKTIMKVLVKAGVDVIIGYGPHCVQPARWVDGAKDADGNVHRTLIMCSTGNFLSDQRDQYFDSGVIFDFTIQETGSGTGKYTITAPTYIPTYVWRAQGEGENYTYHTLAVGQWLEDAPEGMAYADAARMRQVWADLQSVMGSNVATVAAE